MNHRRTPWGKRRVFKNTIKHSGEKITTTTTTRGFFVQGEKSGPADFKYGFRAQIQFRHVAFPLGKLGVFKNTTSISGEKITTTTTTRGFFVQGLQTEISGPGDFKYGFRAQSKSRCSLCHSAWTMPPFRRFFSMQWPKHPEQ
jgi:hypothetical protein